ncbi:MAG TPA: hypothetical protein VGH27_31310 [Streptosporangiaceae bacterium]
MRRTLMIITAAAVALGGAGVANAITTATWTLQPIASPAGATFSGLDGVSCTAADSCTAVGDAGTSGTDAPLAEHWNGTKWSQQHASSGFVSGEFDPAHARHVWLVVQQPVGVSCPTKTNCTAVGYYQNASGNDITKADHWNGTVWNPQITAAPRAGKDLSGVSCATASSCTAIGYFLNIGRQTPESLAEQH